MIHQEVVEQLQPFIVTSWHGHRDDSDIPEAVTHVWNDKFNPRRGSRSGNQSNVDLAILDSSGNVVHWFDGFSQPNNGRRPSLANFTAREIQSTLSRLDLRDLPKRNNELLLPDLELTRGIRVFVRLMDDRMPAYQAPVVEVVELNDNDWEQLAWPETDRSVDAASLAKWLRQVYPPGVMERTNQQTKQAYRIRSVDGTLSLVQAESDDHQRFACLSGVVKLTDEGDDGFFFEGKLEIVLTYDLHETKAVSLRGVFEGIYPRFDPNRDQPRQIPLQAVFESLPGQTARPARVDQ